ncbi:MAG: putative molybdenum carrier protein [Magnetococcales bacterium]|nr:putative molybdenum carrier protein [Magnetococcales bacterium]
MVIERIVSGGQTGVDRAALDFALERHIPCGGWCPSGRRAMDGPIPPHYPLQETPSRAYSQRTGWNVRDSDGTLIIGFGGPLSGGTALTLRVAEKQGKPCKVVSLNLTMDPNCVLNWVLAVGIKTLNVAGPREDADLRVYQRARNFLRALELQPPPL